MKLYGRDHWKVKSPLDLRPWRFSKRRLANNGFLINPGYRIMNLRRYYIAKRRSRLKICDSDDRSQSSKSQVAKQSKANSLFLQQEENSFYQHYQKVVHAIQYSGDNFFSNDTEELILERENNWTRLHILAKPLVEYFSWSIPTTALLSVFLPFSPILEIGAGKGYWAYQLKRIYGHRIKIRSFDRYPNYRHSWTLVEKGTPETIFAREDILSADPPFQTLFLSYPDETDQVGLTCLQHFQGDYVIHIGELAITGSFVREPQSCFGRTSSSAFQIELMNKFHLIAAFPVPSFPFCNDYLTIWKRTEWVLGRGHYVRRVLRGCPPGDADDNNNTKEEESEEHTNSNEDSQSHSSSASEGSREESSELDYWANIPTNERYCMQWVCPAFQFLLLQNR